MSRLDCVRTDRRLSFAARDWLSEGSRPRHYAIGWAQLPQLAPSSSPFSSQPPPLYPPISSPPPSPATLLLPLVFPFHSARLPSTLLSCTLISRPNERERSSQQARSRCPVDDHFYLIDRPCFLAQLRRALSIVSSILFPLSGQHMVRLEDYARCVISQGLAMWDVRAQFSESVPQRRCVPQWQRDGIL